MLIKLNEKEKSLIRRAKVEFQEDKDYTDDEILEMADVLFDVFLELSESRKKDAPLLAGQYSDLVDKLQDLLPEEE